MLPCTSITIRFTINFASVLQCVPSKAKACSDSGSNVRVLHCKRGPSSIDLQGVPWAVAFALLVQQNACTQAQPFAGHETGLT